MNPRLPAKGTGLTAEQILQIARLHGMRLHTGPELAQIPLVDEIPNEQLCYRRGSHRVCVFLKRQ